MLNDSDKTEIKKIVKSELKPLERTLESVKESVINLEQDRKILKDIWEFIFACRTLWTISPRMNAREYILPRK
ncbi:hypothetical protein A3I53_01040 [Candidatus Curtissbacteria bacterium RIFCSPLOWO2_02_FULL_40_13b]|uniref:Uncharacterized protein n=1 Tax=Candidatus Curtissbacteria bacterium RIFCSPLOWO2_02_FULL_40_13b TaxID=1797733 RepID=A0A1F5HYA8_9BACT|nr:MAG: hypothetical protein A3I53_01040 [Candidatus Curtissbacteria bacterium RIFCSPLOWO2_02_FULL_40_13b]